MLEDVKMMLEEQTNFNETHLAKFMAYFEDKRNVEWLTFIGDPNKLPLPLQQVIHENYPDFPPFEYWQQQYERHEFGSPLEFADSIVEYFGCVQKLFPDDLHGLPADIVAPVSIFETFHQELQKLKKLLLLDERTAYVLRLKYLAKTFNNTYEYGFRNHDDEKIFPSLSPFGIFPSHDIPDMVNPMEI